jgi:hypothetical protein
LVDKYLFKKESVSLEVVSKPQIRLKSKAQADEKAQSRQRRDEQVHFEEVCNAAI